MHSTQQGPRTGVLLPGPGCGHLVPRSPSSPPHAGRSPDVPFSRYACCHRGGLSCAGSGGRASAAPSTWEQERELTPLNPAAATGHHGGRSAGQSGDLLVGSQEGVVGPGRGGASTRMSPAPAPQPDPVKMGPVPMATLPSNSYCAKPVVPYQGWVPRPLLKPRPWATQRDLKEPGGQGSKQDRHLGRSHSQRDGPQGWHGACRAQQLGCTPGIRKGASGRGCGHVGKVVGTLRPAACRVGEGTLT